MRRGRKLRHVRKTERVAQVLAEPYRFLRILFRRRHDVVCAFENRIVAVLDAVDLAPRHRVRGYEFYAVRQNGLNFIDNARFYARYVRYDGAFFQIFAVVFYPFDENMRVKRENGKIRPADKLVIGRRRAVCDDPLGQRVIDGRLRARYALDRKALFRKRFCVASA